MKSRASSDFWKCHDQLPGHIQKLALKNFRLWTINPWHPSLHFKPIKGRLWSARVVLGTIILAIVGASLRP